jgi:hypothetical protein
VEVEDDSDVGPLDHSPDEVSVAQLELGRGEVVHASLESQRPVESRGVEAGIPDRAVHAFRRLQLR